MDYEDMLNQKRQEENSYRSGDPFGGNNGGGGNLRNSNSEGYLASNAFDDSFSLGNGLSELSGAVSSLLKNIIQKQ